MVVPCEYLPRIRNASLLAERERERERERETERETERREREKQGHFTVSF
jgi:hypothetical protein